MVTLKSAKLPCAGSIPAQASKSGVFMEQAPVGLACRNRRPCEQILERAIIISTRCTASVGRDPAQNSKSIAIQ